MSTPALKEWAVIVRALLAGEQILDVRKGGLREDGRHFGLHATRLWLYPTTEHQQDELLKPAYRRWIDETEATAPGDPIRVEGWADITAVATITDRDELAALDSRLVWTLDYAASRLRWKQRDPLWVLVLRTHRLVEPLEIPWSDDYRGCSSWVDLRGLPDDPEALPSETVLSDEGFAARLGLIEQTLPGRFEAPSTEPAGS